MANSYYNLSEKAVPFSTLDPRPYNRELDHVERGFDQIQPDIALGLTYFKELTSALDPSGVPYPDQYVFTIPSFPGNALTGTPAPTGLTFSFTLPADNVGGQASIFVSDKVDINDPTAKLFAIISMLDANLQPYPVGTFKAGVVYSAIIAPGVGPLLGGNVAQVLNGAIATDSVVSRFNNFRLTHVPVPNAPVSPPIGSMLMASLRYNIVGTPPALFPRGVGVPLGSNMNLIACNAAGEPGSPQFSGGVWAPINAVTTPTNGNLATRVLSVSIWVRVG